MAVSVPSNTRFVSTMEGLQGAWILVQKQLLRKENAKAVATASPISPDGKTMYRPERENSEKIVVVHFTGKKPVAAGNHFGVRRVK